MPSLGAPQIIEFPPLGGTGSEKRRLRVCHIWGRAEHALYRGPGPPGSANEGARTTQDPSPLRPKARAGRLAVARAPWATASPGASPGASPARRRAGAAISSEELGGCRVAPPPLRAPPENPEELGLAKGRPCPGPGLYSMALRSGRLALSQEPRGPQRPSLVLLAQRPSEARCAPHRVPRPHYCGVIVPIPPPRSPSTPETHPSLSRRRHASGCVCGVAGAARLLRTTHTPPEGARPAPPNSRPIPNKRSFPSQKSTAQLRHRRPKSTPAGPTRPEPAVKTPSHCQGRPPGAGFSLSDSAAHSRTPVVRTPSCQDPCPGPVLVVRRVTRLFTCLVRRSSQRRGCQRLARRAGASRRGGRGGGAGAGRGAVAPEEVSVRTNHQAASRTPCPASRFTGKVLLRQTGTGYLSQRGKNELRFA